MPGNHRKKTSSAKKVPAATALSAALVVAVVWSTTRDGDSTAPPSARAAAAAAPPTSRPAAVGIAQPVPFPVLPASLAEPPAFLDLAKAACSANLSGTRPHVAMVGNFLKNMFGVRNVGGAIGRAGGNDEHSVGLALDFMTPDPALGTALANYILANQRRLGVTYVIWQQRYNAGGGWSMMENRGSATANHYDHVHVSFAPAAKVDVYC